MEREIVVGLGSVVAGSGASATATVMASCSESGGSDKGEVR